MTPDELRPTDYAYGTLLLIGLSSLIAFHWLPGLALFVAGAAGVLANSTRWDAS